MTDRASRILVHQRARHRCEYCGQPDLPLLPLQIDHIIARQPGGNDDLDNLCLACSYCNSHKGPNLSGVDPHTGEIVALFHPRREAWNRHFRWRGPRAIGRTAMGRATIVVLAINDDDRIRLRQAMRAEGIPLR